MKNVLRFALLSILMLCGLTTYAQTTFDFDNAYATLFPTLTGVSSSNSNAGDFTEATTSTPIDGITVTVSAKTSGSNANRIWTSSARLRMYSGTLTITAPAGKNIISIEFTGNKWNANNSSTPEGVVASGNNATWTGSANEVVISVAGNTQLKSLTVYLEGEEVVDLTNTPETAYTVAEANELITAGAGLSTQVYVKGIISEIQEVSTQYKNAGYYISDDGSTTGQLYVYRGRYLENTDFTAEDQIKVGDEVIVYGELTDYNGTYEFKQGNYIHSLNGETSGINGVTVETLDENAPTYNLAGQPVSPDTKGIVIQKGKKFVRK